MNIKLLKLLARSRGLNQSDLARVAGVSRQAVSLWMKNGRVDVRTRHLQNLSRTLAIPLADLVEPLPLPDRSKERAVFEKTLLWDRLYPALEDFALALARKETPAMARLVQAFGLFQAAKIAGPAIWRKFHDYKMHIHPVRRQACERLYQLQKGLNLI